jgi:hypothetical protein
VSLESNRVGRSSFGCGWWAQGFGSVALGACQYFTAGVQKLVQGEALSGVAVQQPQHVFLVRSQLAQHALREAAAFPRQLSVADKSIDYLQHSTDGELVNSPPMFVSLSMLMRSAAQR